MTENPGLIAVFIDRGGEVGLRVGGDVLGTEQQVGIIDLRDNEVHQSLVDLLTLLDLTGTAIFDILIRLVVVDLIKRRQENKSSEAVVWEIEVDGLVKFCNIPEGDYSAPKERALARLLGGIAFRDNINFILVTTWRLLKADGFFDREFFGQTAA